MNIRYMKRLALLLLLTCSVVACVNEPVRGQDVTPGSTDAATSAESTTAATKPPVGPARAEFDRVFKNWKELLKTLRDLEEKFALAEADETDELRQQFLTELDRGRKMLPEVRRAAMAAYAESPGTDTDLTSFLVTLLKDEVDRDEFESGYELGKLLIDKGPNGVPEDKAVYDLAGVAAYATHDFDNAEKYLKEAQAYAVIDKGSNYLPAIPEVRSAWEVEQGLRAAEATADDLPRVKLQTSKGTIVLELFENEAPDTVGNFIALVKKGFYDGLVFHRVLPGFMAQGGDPRGDGTGGPGYTIFCECLKENHRNHFRGSLSMAKSAEPNTGGSQFFLTFLPTPHLNGAHTVFGRVVEGIDVLAKLQRRNPDDAKQTAIAPDRIIKAEVIRDRGHEYKPNPASRG